MEKRKEESLFVLILNVVSKSFTIFLRKLSLSPYFRVIFSFLKDTELKGSLYLPSRKSTFAWKKRQGTWQTHSVAAAMKHTLTVERLFQLAKQISG